LSPTGGLAKGNPAGGAGRAPAYAEAQRMHGPVAVDGIGPSEAWQDYWRQSDSRRR